MKSSNNQTPDVITINDNSNNSSSSIDWTNLNFPPCLKLMHFSLAEIQGPVKRFVLVMYSSYLISIIVMIINCIFLL